MEEEMKIILNKYLKEEINKDEVIKTLKENNILIKDYNSYILNIFKKCRSEKRYDIEQLQYKCKKPSLKTSKIIDENFLNEIKNQMIAYKPINCNFKLSNEDITKAISENQKLIKYFTASFSVLSSKTRKFLNNEDVKKKLERCAVECGLNENVNLECAEFLNNAGFLYVKDLFKKVMKNTNNSKDIRVKDLKKVIRKEGSVIYFIENNFN